MRHLATAFGLAAISIFGVAQGRAQQCDPLRGQVVDVTGAVVVGAQVQVDGAAVRTDRTGQFASGCIDGKQHRIRISAEGFEPTTIRTSASPVLIRLKPHDVVTEIDVTEAGTGVDSQDVAGSKTINKDDLKQLADDPDEFARQLQVLAAAAGGAPGQAIIAVDGFQNGGRIPPKSSIAFIRINPDLFSSEYERPPYQGGRIEIYTKPGQDKLHGALFATDSFAWMNARDPFALTRAALGRQRYGFELSGPIKPKKADFAVALEHREIDQFAVVNAVTLDSAYNPVSFVANVATPQILWSGSLRAGWLIDPRNNFTATYTAGVNEFTNLGVGGTALQQAGYNSVQSEHSIRLTNLQTLSSRLIHESRLGYTWRYRDDTPNSTATSLQVAGAFTSGGVATQALSAHERDFEVDDDILYSIKKHSLKLGIELLDIDLHDRMPTNFNGSYLFGGGVTATGGSISGLQQYRLAAQGLPGGTPTSYTVTTGAAPIALNQLRVVLYGQDQWKLKPRLSLAFGLRYAMQSAPGSVGNLAPRAGLAWSPDKKQTWVFHLRSGLFFTPIDSNTILTAQRLDGVHQTQTLTYNPTYGTLPGGGSAPIATVRQLAPGTSQTPSWQSHLGIEHDLPGHWHVQSNFYLARAWDELRSSNINAPNSVGARPFGGNRNVLQFQQTGHLHGNVLFLGVDQHSLKHVQIFLGYVRQDLRSDTDGDTFFTQGRSDAGETARPTWEATHHVFAFSTISLPRKVSFSTQFDSASGSPYNVTTGFDNNGDGVFNDRPSYAAASDPATATDYVTRFGRLTPSGTGPSVARNLGTLPWNIHLDLNLSRSFTLTHPAHAEGQRIAVNLRSTNALNHTNVTAVGGVLGSPNFGEAYAADPGRRIEFGLRYSF